MMKSRRPSYLEPFAIGGVDGFDQLGIVEVERVRPDADDGTVLLMELLDDQVVVAGADLSETPQVGVAWSRSKESTPSNGTDNNGPRSVRSPPGDSTYLRGRGRGISARAK